MKGCAKEKTKVIGIRSFTLGKPKKKSSTNVQAIKALPPLEISSPTKHKTDNQNPT